jgi:hypothetical protein
MSQQILIESFSPAEAQLIESHDAQKNLYLAGRMMAGDVENLNKRKYPKAEIIRAVESINKRIKEGNLICGELEHPSDLKINLSNVCHAITEAWMDGSNACGKCKILNTPSGGILKGLVEGGVKVGLSTRGTGNVNHQGIVESFELITVDAVSQPSGPGCYPDAVRESLENTKILTLAEAVVHDTAAQKYLTKEILKFINTLYKK